MRKKVENNFAVLFASPPSTLAVQSAGQVLLTLNCKEEREGEGGKMMALTSPSTLAVQSAGQVLLTLSCREREGEGGKMMALASPSCRGWGGGEGEEEERQVLLTLRCSQGGRGAGRVCRENGGRGAGRGCSEKGGEGRGMKGGEEDMRG